MKRILVALILVLAVALPVLAEDNEAAPDYSREKLLLIFRDVDFTAGVEKPVPEGLSATRWGTVTYRKKSLLAMFLPLMPVLQVNGGEFGHAYSDQPVDPFHMLNVSFPYAGKYAESSDVPEDPNATLRERWSRNQYRKKMLLLVRSENSRDND